MKMSPEAYDAMIIKDYSAMLENLQDGYIHDISLLPHPKDIILKALLLKIATVNDPDYVHAAVICAISLSDFQHGVGESIHTPISETPDQLKEYDWEKLQNFLDTMIEEKQSTGILIDKFEKLNPINRKICEQSNANFVKNKDWRRLFGL